MHKKQLIKEKELGIVTLEERHQMDMPYKILSGKEKGDPNCWFTMASNSEKVTRQFADPVNIIGQEHQGWT
jgi:hypothetical protein